MLKRSSQSFIRFAADQIGVQNESDQVFNDEQLGHLESSYIATRAKTDKERRELDGFVDYIFQDEVRIISNAETNLGTREQN